MKTVLLLYSVGVFAGMLWTGYHTLFTIVSFWVALPECGAEDTIFVERPGMPAGEDEGDVVDVEAVEVAVVIRGGGGAGRCGSCLKAAPPRV